MSEAGLSWQESVARLGRERSLAESYARLLKKYGDGVAVDRGSLTYAEAKAEYDAVISALIVTLAQKQKPASLPDLQDRLQRGFDKREEFCKMVEPWIPAETGHKGLIKDMVSGAVSPVLDAVKDIYLRSKDDDVLARKTIETQLQAAAWAEFAAIQQAP